MNEPFDPDAYLAEAKAQAPKFDPTTYLAERGALPETSGPATFVRSGADAIPLGRQAVDLASAALLHQRPGAVLTPQAKAQLAAMGELPEEKGFIDTYREVRDNNALLRAAGAQQNPWWSRAGTGTGLIASIAAGGPAARVGTGAAGRVASAGLTGAGYGTLNALTHGKADLTRPSWETAKQVGKDISGVEQFQEAGENMSRGEYGRMLLNLMSAGAPGGLVSGLALGGATEAAAPYVAKASEALAINRGRKVIQGNSDIAAAGRKPLSDEAVLQTLKEKLLKPFSDTKGTYLRIDKAAEEAGNVQGDIIKELEAMGVKGPDAQRLAYKFMEGWEREAPVATANKAVPDAYVAEAGNAERLAKDTGGQFGLSQAEGYKRNLQKQARLDRLKQTGTEEAYEEMASMARQANEDAIAQAASVAGPGSRTAELGAQFVPAKQRTGNLLEARTFAERGASKAAQRQSIGLPDYIMGAATGNPAAAFATAMGTSILRNRVPSATAAYSYALANALRSGAAPTQAARMAEMFAGTLLDR